MKLCFVVHDESMFQQILCSDLYFAVVVIGFGLLSRYCHDMLLRVDILVAKNKKVQQKEKRYGRLLKAHSQRMILS